MRERMAWTWGAPFAVPIGTCGPPRLKEVIVSEALWELAYSLPAIPLEELGKLSEELERKLSEAKDPDEGAGLELRWGLVCEEIAGRMPPERVIDIRAQM
jgi:hypothetical protein